MKNLLYAVLGVLLMTAAHASDNKEPETQLRQRVLVPSEEGMQYKRITPDEMFKREHCAHSGGRDPHRKPWVNACLDECDNCCGLGGRRY